SKAVSIKDQANLALSERRVVNAETATENARRTAAANLQIAEGRLKEQQRANTLREKTDGPNVGKAATNAEVATAKTVIKNTVKALEGVTLAEGTPEEASFNHMAEDIVGRAKILVSENKGITFPEAVEQAVMKSEAAGDYKTLS